MQAIVSIGLFTLVTLVASIEYAPIVRLRNGRVYGMTQQVENGGKVYFYQGIPYGQAARFGKPQFAKPWSGIYNATYYREACPQHGLEQEPFGLGSKTTNISEDCLYLNVWRPRRNRFFPTRSVMVFFHGGTYKTGTIFSPLYDARHLANLGDVIVVSIQYRVGPFGFLYGNTTDAPGNVGLHDQILGLKWIHYNIARFGGDIAQVTIFGHEAGAMSVGSLILSPLAFRHFRRAIMLSGSPISYYGGTNQSEALERTRQFAEKLECMNVNMSSVIECLRNKTVEQILSVTKGQFLKNQMFLPIYGDELMPYKPSDALKEGKLNFGVDLLYGVNENEGLQYANLFVADQNNITLESIKESIKWMMHYYGDSSYSDIVFERYTSELLPNASKEMLLATLGNVWEDFIITCPTVLFAQEYAKKSPGRNFYSYRLAQSKCLNEPTLLSSGDEQVCLGEDVLYLFLGLDGKGHSTPITFNPEDRQLSKDMIYAWSAFAKTGHIRERFNNNRYWINAFDRSTILNAPITRTFNLNFTDYQMVSNMYNQSCDSFWKDKLFA